MKRKWLATLLSALCVTCGMFSAGSISVIAEETAAEEEVQAEEPGESGDADQAAADHVAELIDKIYVQ